MYFFGKISKSSREVALYLAKLKSSRDSAFEGRPSSLVIEDRPLYLGIVVAELVLVVDSVRSRLTDLPGA